MFAWMCEKSALVIEWLIIETVCLQRALGLPMILLKHSISKYCWT